MSALAGSGATTFTAPVTGFCGVAMPSSWPPKVGPGPCEVQPVRARLGVTAPASAAVTADGESTWLPASSCALGSAFLAIPGASELAWAAALSLKDFSSAFGCLKDPLGLPLPLLAALPAAADAGAMPAAVAA